jgi:hypothetical protein
MHIESRSQISRRPSWLIPLAWFVVLHYFFCCFMHFLPSVTSSFLGQFFISLRVVKFVKDIFLSCYSNGGSWRELSGHSGTPLSGYSGTPLSGRSGTLFVWPLRHSWNRFCPSQYSRTNVYDRVMTVLMFFFFFHIRSFPELSDWNSPCSWLTAWSRVLQALCRSDT